MTCYLCNTETGWLILRDAAGNTAAQHCPEREPGRRMIEAREAHAKQYRPRERERKPLTARGVAKIWKERQGA